MLLKFCFLLFINLASCQMKRESAVLINGTEDLDRLLSGYEELNIHPALQEPLANALVEFVELYPPPSEVPESPGSYPDRLQPDTESNTGGPQTHPATPTPYPKAGTNSPKAGAGAFGTCFGNGSACPAGMKRRTRAKRDFDLRISCSEMEKRALNVESSRLRRLVYLKLFIKYCCVQC